MQAIISADELAKDVAGAEALLERHQEHKGEIDARGDSLDACLSAGRDLVESGHPSAAEVSSRMRQVADMRSTLAELWEERRVRYEQCMDLQLFYRDTEQADTWMAKQEAFLANEDRGDSLDSVEALIKKHEDFEKSLAAQEEKIKALDEFATKLIEGQHYAADDVAQRREMVSFSPSRGSSPVGPSLTVYFFSCWRGGPLCWRDRVRGVCCSKMRTSCNSSSATVTRPKVSVAGFALLSNRLVRISVTKFI